MSRLASIDVDERGSCPSIKGQQTSPDSPDSSDPKWQRLHATKLPINTQSIIHHESSLHYLGGSYLWLGHRLALDLDRRATSKSWAGTSNYFIQGLSAEDQQAYLKQLSAAGVKAIRLWVNSQSGNGACVKGSISATSVPELETTIGQYNNETLDALDQTLVWVGQNGLKAIISPHDGNKLNGANGYVIPRHNPRHA